MRTRFTILALGLLLAPQSVASAETDLLVASPDAPLFQLSNLRTETDRFGSRVLSFDYKRTRPGSGSVTVRGRSQRGYATIAAHILSSSESGTMQLKSLLPSRGQQPIDIEIFLAQRHDWGDGKVRYAVVSNSLRLGNPGPAIQPRAWTEEEQQAHQQYKRIMADDTAQKPRKSYPVSIDVPDGSQFLPTQAKVSPGTPLMACYSDKWSPLTALSENKDGSVNVRWDAYGASYDCSMVRAELVINKAFLIAEPATGALRTLSRRESEDRGLVVVEATPKPRKSYPVSIDVPGHSQLVPQDLKLPAGTPLQACYAGKWNPITTLSENQDGSLNVRWDDYGPAYDCSMVREELIIRKTRVQKLRQPPPAAPPTGPPTEPSPWRTWTDATGNFSVRARLLGKSDTTVTLTTEAGRELTVPISKLSEADREFLRKAKP